MATKIGKEESVADMTARRNEVRGTSPFTFNQSCALVEIRVILASLTEAGNCRVNEGELKNYVYAEGILKYSNEDKRKLAEPPLAVTHLK